MAVEEKQQDPNEVGRITVDGRQRVVLAVPPSAFSGADTEVAWMEVIQGLEEDYVLVNRDTMHKAVQAYSTDDQEAAVMAITMQVLHAATKHVVEWLKSRSNDE